MTALLSILLPARDRLRGGIAASTAPDLTRTLLRADRLPAGKPGRDAQLQRHADVLPRTLAPAAITRQLDAGDGKAATWLRADPAHVRADMATGRMLACGELGLTLDEARELVAPLRILFGDEGFPIDAPVPSRWYLMMPMDAKLPPMAAPADVLGDDLHEHLPAGNDGRRWRRLLNEAQVILHNHPLNAARAAAGKLPVNSVWFWGGGRLPDHVKLACEWVFTRDPLLAGLAAIAGRSALPPALDTMSAVRGAALLDLADVRDVADVERDWLPAALAALRERRVGALRFDFADGASFEYRQAHCWRFWRRGVIAGG